MIYPNFGRSGTDATAERWASAGPSISHTLVAAETNARIVVSDYCTLFNFGVKRNTAPGTGTSVAYKVVKNGVNTGLVTTVTDTNTLSTTDTTHSVSCVPGDFISIDVLPTGTVSTSAFAFSFDVNGNGQVLVTGDTTAQTAGTLYVGPQGYDILAANTHVAQVFSAAGVIDNAFMHLTVTTGAAKTWQATFVLNGNDTSLVVAVTNGTDNSDTAHTVNVVRGDVGYWRIDATNTPATSRIDIGCRFTPSTDGESVQMSSTTLTTSVSANNFGALGGGAAAYSATENIRDNYLTSSYDFKKLIASQFNTSGAGGSGAKYTYTLRGNGVDTTETFDVIETATTGSDISSVIPLSGAWSVNVKGTNTPSATQASWSLVTYRAPTGLPRMVQTAGASVTANADTVTANFAKTTNAAGQTLVAVIQLRRAVGANTVSGVTDNKGNTWSKIPGTGTAFSTAQGWHEWWYLVGGIGGVFSVTATATTSGNNNWGMTIYELANANTIDQVNQSTSGGASTVTASTGPTSTLTSANEIVLVATGWHTSAGTISGATAYSLQTQQGSNTSPVLAMCSGWLGVVASTAVSASMSNTVSGLWVATIVTFKYIAPKTGNFFLMF